LKKAEDDNKKQREENHKIFEELRDKLKVWEGRDKDADGTKKVNHFL
jgi:hypothetical protein